MGRCGRVCCLQAVSYTHLDVYKRQLWIIASDRLLSLVTDDPALLGPASMIKGLAFVIVTTGLLYLLLCGWYESLIKTDAGDAATPRLQRRYCCLLYTSRCV